MCSYLSEWSPGKKIAESVDLLICNFIDTAKLPSMEVTPDYFSTAVYESICLTRSFFPTQNVAKLLDLCWSVRGVGGWGIWGLTEAGEGVDVRW